MYRAMKVLALCGVVLAAGCADSSKITAELESDLALASAGADLELASRATSATNIVGAVERTTPPSRAIASSARAPRPRRSPRPQIQADVQEQSEIVEEPEVAAVEDPMPEPAPVEEAPVEIAASTGGVGQGPRGGEWGTIGNGGTVVIRGGDVGEDRCIPPGGGRGSWPILINDRFPQPRARGTGRVVMGGSSTGRVVMGGGSGRVMGGGTGGRVVMGGRTGGRQVINTAPAKPRDVANRPSSSGGTLRPMGAGSGMAIGGGATAIENTARDRGDMQ